MKQTLLVKELLIALNYEGGNFEKTIENLKKAQLKLQTITENNFVTIHEVLEARHD